MVGRVEGFDPALLTRLVLGRELVRAQAVCVLGVAVERHREGEVLFRVAELHDAVLQHNHTQKIALAPAFPIKQQVPLEGEPTFLVGCVQFPLWRQRFTYSLVFFSIKATTVAFTTSDKSSDLQHGKGKKKTKKTQQHTTGFQMMTSQQNDVLRQNLERLSDERVEKAKQQVSNLM